MGMRPLLERVHILRSIWNFIFFSKGVHHSLEELRRACALRLSKEMAFKGKRRRYLLRSFSFHDLLCSAFISKELRRACALCFSEEKATFYSMLLHQI